MNTCNAVIALPGRRGMSAAGPFQRANCAMRSMEPDERRRAVPKGELRNAQHGCLMNAARPLRV